MITFHRFIAPIIKWKSNIFIEINLFFWIGGLIDVGTTSIMSFRGKSMEQLEFFYYYTGFDIPPYYLGVACAFFLHPFDIV
jgi:hypothetical protein